MHLNDESPEIHFCAWDAIPERTMAELRKLPLVGPELEKFYEQYFYWYNIPHEFCHILRFLHGTRTRSLFAEETTCNRFAVSFWRSAGHSSRLADLKTALERNLSKLPSPVPTGEEWDTYFDHHSQELQDALSYGFYQFNMVVAAIDQEPRFEQELAASLGHGCPAGPVEALCLDAMDDSNQPFRTVACLTETLRALGIATPEIKVVHDPSPALQFAIIPGSGQT